MTGRCLSSFFLKLIDFLVKHRLVHDLSTLKGLSSRMKDFDIIDDTAVF